jgi:hypothetical protein
VAYRACSFVAAFQVEHRVTLVLVLVLVAVVAVETVVVVVVVAIIFFADYMEAFVG